MAVFSFKSSLQAGCCELGGTRQVHSILIQCTSAQSELAVPAVPGARVETGKAVRNKEQGKAAAVAKCFLSMTVVLPNVLLHSLSLHQP